MSYKNLHMILTPDRSAASKKTMSDEEYAAAIVWTCGYCGEKGTFKEMTYGRCSHTYPVCEHCGGCEESNECRPDCVGVAAALAGAPEVEAAKAELQALKRKLEN